MRRAGRVKGNRRPQWSELRRLVWIRDGGRCVACGTYLEEWWECHHRRYRSRRGHDELANLIALCPSCHKTRVHEDYTGLAEVSGWSVSAYGDGPELIPVRYFDGESRLLTNDSEMAA